MRAGQMLNNSFVDRQNRGCRIREDIRFRSGILYELKLRVNENSRISYKIMFEVLTAKRFSPEFRTN
jgi:hypothetical protein